MLLATRVFIEESQERRLFGHFLEMEERVTSKQAERYQEPEVQRALEQVPLQVQLPLEFRKRPQGCDQRCRG